MTPSERREVNRRAKLEMELRVSTKELEGEREWLSMVSDRRKLGKWDSIKLEIIIDKLEARQVAFDSVDGMLENSDASEAPEDFADAYINSYDRIWRAYRGVERTVWSILSRNYSDYFDKWWDAEKFWADFKEHEAAGLRLLRKHCGQHFDEWFDYKVALGIKEDGGAGL